MARRRNLCSISCPGFFAGQRETYHGLTNMNAQGIPYPILLWQFIPRLLWKNGAQDSLYSKRQLRQSFLPLQNEAVSHALFIRCCFRFRIRAEYYYWDFFNIPVSPDLRTHRNSIAVGQVKVQYYTVRFMERRKSDTVGAVCRGIYFIAGSFEESSYELMP